MPLKHTLLRFLQTEPMHGYKLRRHARECAWMYPMANASIYPALHSLETEGFIDHQSEIHNGRARKVYRITNAGRQELRNWLSDSEPVGSSHRDQALLKVAMQSHETISGAREWLQKAITQLESDLSDLLRGGTADASSSEYSNLAIAYGTDLIKLRKEFLTKVLQASEMADKKTPASGMARVRKSESLSA